MFSSSKVIIADLRQLWEQLELPYSKVDYPIQFRECRLDCKPGVRTLPLLDANVRTDTSC